VRFEDGELNEMEEAEVEAHFEGEKAKEEESNERQSDEDFLNSL